MLQQSKPITWEDVPREAYRLAKAAVGTYQVIQDLVPSLPEIDAKLWYNPDKQDLHITYQSLVDSAKQASWYIAMKQVPGIETVTQRYISQQPLDGPYMKVAAGSLESILRPLASAAQMEPNALNKLWGGPSPLSATIGGGLLGAGLGYAGGWLADQLLPDEWFDKTTVRRNAMMLGGVAGAMPGMWHGIDQQFRGHPPGIGNWVRPFPWHKAASDITNVCTGLSDLFSAEVTELNDHWKRAAFDAGSDFTPMIPVDQFGRVIWNDLRTQGGYTDPGLAAATTGLVQAASLSREGAAVISPVDVARIGIGMGSGYVSGLLVGKTLGALAGLRPAAQQTLQRTGTWAGILANTIPLVFGG